MNPARRPADQRATLIGLGLNKRHKRSTLQDTPAVRGMNAKVQHLVRVFYPQSFQILFMGIFESRFPTFILIIEQSEMKIVIPVFRREIADRRKHPFHAFVVLLFKIFELFSKVR